MKIFLRPKIGYQEPKKVEIEVDPTENIGSLKKKYKVK